MLAFLDVFFQNSAMHFTSLLASSLATYSLVAASPLLPIIQTSPQNPAVNGSLSLDSLPPPGGPPAFSIRIDEARRTLEQDAVILPTLRFIGALAQQDWTGQLPAPRTVYRDPLSPGVAIGVAAVGSTHIERRFVLWGLASFADYMVQSRRFRASQARIRWETIIVGLIRFVDVGTSTGQQELEGYSGMDLSSTILLTNESTTPVGVGDDGLTWDIDFVLEEIPKVSIFMATIASLVQAAQHDDDIRHFIGSWPYSSYEALHTWLSTETPSVFSRNILIKSMLAAVEKGIAQNDFRATDVLVKQDGRNIAQGGYAHRFTPPMSPRIDVPPSFSLDFVE